ncbi:hypothetical protein QBC33DRAFT_196131 [Phialemonium atrogriseum]|uniref:HCNGP-like protein n=1 Tax=Phialemonium atrogriseum TaxID=1093897 RepID=A0AAJ0BUT4_9PEZI|nr:uncharacterized protein QBC33DRAFT_196131 [Phialemonium atrogriseum]KAK1764710.1 hypothetical protein QBC33DRAFT_196131 [Phialemonium atrogriseum]
MSGLVAYESSDEEEDVREETQPQLSSSAENKPVAKPQHGSAPVSSTSTKATEPPREKSLALGSALAPAPGPALGPVMGPALGPSLPPSTSSTTTPNTTTAITTPLAPLPEPDADLDPDAQPQDPPRSPTSAARALLRDLTLPAVPDMDIPLSPPRPASLDALNARLETLLEMKRRRGDLAPAHFNARLAGSGALRNPALMDKLLGFAGVGAAAGDGDGDGEGVLLAAGQYATTLSAGVWDPAAFPAWAARAPLRRAQERAQRERERGRGEAVDFVPAGGSRGGTPGGGVAPVTGKRKTRFDA